MDQNNTGGLCVYYYMNLFNADPIANPDGPYLGASMNTAILFDGTGSSDADGDPLTYAWTFGDGEFGTGKESIAHIHHRQGFSTFASG